MCSLIRTSLRKTFLPIVLALFFQFFPTDGLFAQSRYSVTGIVMDSLQRKPLQGVAVSVYPASNSKNTKTTLTNASGSFVFDLNEAGEFILDLNYQGFGRVNRKIMVSGVEQNVGNFFMAPSSKTLRDVTVTATKKLVEQTDDKIIYNVDADPSSKGQSTIDILRKIPFVSVDGDDNVRINGQSNFRVLLNGRETAMFAQNVKDALMGFPGATIVKIEVITNPSARYDAEGVGGIINIITKKKVQGYNGSVSTWSTSINQHNFNTNFNAKFNNIGITLNYGTRLGINIPSASLITTIPHTNSYYKSRFLEGHRELNSFWNFGNAELSWMVDSLSTLSFYGNVSGGSSRVNLDQLTTTVFNNSADPVYSHFDQNNKRVYPTTTVGTDYIKKYTGKPEKEFSLRVNAELGKSNSFLESEENTSSYTRYIINSSEASNRQYTLQSDYVLPLQKGKKLEIGGRLTFRRGSSDFESMVRYDQGAFKLNPNNTDNFDFAQDVYSSYASYSFKIKTFSFRTGLRLEHTRIDGRFQSSKAFAKNSYSNVLPNLQVSKKIKDLSLILSYNQRLQRPFINHLNPFVDNNDSLNISYGNPDLDAQTIHNIGLQSRMQKGKTTFGLNFNTSYSNNMIVNVILFNPANGVRSSTFENIGRDLLFSANGNVNSSLGKKWMLNANINAQYRIVKNKMMPQQSNSGIGGNTSVGVNFNPGLRLSFNHYIGFEQAIVDLQNSPNTIPFCGTGVTFQAVPNKLRMTLMAQNYYARFYDYTNEIKGLSFEGESTNRFRMGKMVFSMNWNFGKLKEKVSKKVGVTNNDIYQ